ncbi:MAG: tetratricopeptide repeat protein [Nannocystaceae bacterium]|nr:tetratricopeptide repeat protein [Nannocystaceae bacterium]
MSDPSGQPPADGEEGTAQEPEFRDDALSELMTGAYAATSVVAMGVKGGEGDLPAPPVWAPPADDVPTAETLDPASGSPAQIPSGPHARVEPEVEIELDTDFGEPPAALTAAAADVVAPRASDAITVPLSGPLSAGPLGPPVIDIEVSSGDYPAHRGYNEDGEDREDEGEAAASISTESGVVVTPQHAQGARLTGAYPTISPQLRSPSPRRERSSTPWLIGGAIVLGLLAVGVVVVKMNGGVIDDSVPVADVADAEPARARSAAVAPPKVSPPGRDRKGDLPAEKDEASEPAGHTTPEVGDSPSASIRPAPAGTPKSTYATALARYESDPTNPGLLQLTLTACSLGLGPEARTAFHKLVGGKARSKAVVKCRGSGVDVTSKANGFTGAEIAEQARAALDEGHPAQALALAKQSNRTERNHAALELMVLAHCQLKQKKSAKKLLRHVPEKRRAEIIRDCAEHGVKLRRWYLSPQVRAAFVPAQSSPKTSSQPSVSIAGFFAAEAAVATFGGPTFGGAASLGATGFVVAPALWDGPVSLPKAGTGGGTNNG